MDHRLSSRVAFYLPYGLWEYVRHKAFNADPNIAVTGSATSIEMTTMVDQSKDSA